MKKVKLEKEHMRRELARQFDESPGFFVTNYAGLSVEKITELRRHIRAAKGNYIVIKNALARLVLEERKLNDAAALVDGPCGFGFVEEDPVAVAKALVTFSKTNEALRLRGGFMDGELLSSDSIKQLASLPAREVLLAKALGALKAPLYEIVNVFAGTYRKLVYALAAVKNKKTEDRSQKTDKEEEGTKNG